MVEERVMNGSEGVEMGVAAARSAIPPFPVPPHLTQIDEPTLRHMQCTLGNELVQRYLEIRRVIELGKGLIHV